MNDHEMTQGWMRLALLWMASFAESLIQSITLANLVSLAVLILTVLQIVKTVRSLRASTHRSGKSTPNPTTE